MTVKPAAGAGADSANVMFCAVPANALNGPGGKLSIAPTCTGWLTDVYPVAAAVMLSFPKFTPTTKGWAAVVVAPLMMVTLEGLIVARDGLPLVRFTVTFESAGAGRLTAIGAD